MSESKLQSKPSQCERILKVLQDANGQWVSGAYFIQTMLISQTHARIFQLQKEGHNIEASEHKNEHNFKYYRLVPVKQQASLFKEENKSEELTKQYCGY
jgi:biotin operon repressor